MLCVQLMCPRLSALLHPTHPISSTRHTLVRPQLLGTRYHVHCHRRDKGIIPSSRHVTDSCAAAWGQRVRVCLQRQLPAAACQLAANAPCAEQERLMQSTPSQIWEAAWTSLLLVLTFLGPAVERVSALCGLIRM